MLSRFARDWEKFKKTGRKACQEKIQRLTEGQEEKEVKTVMSYDINTRQFKIERVIKPSRLPEDVSKKTDSSSSSSSSGKRDCSDN